MDTFTGRPLRLLKNRRYPAYQLYAVTANKKTPPETALTLAVQHTLQWLRERFRDFEIPEPLRGYAAASPADMTPEELKSFYINEGYKVEVLWLPREGNWALQLTEPDLGPAPGEAAQARAPVPGRLFETNVAYHLRGDRVECAFCTVIAEPENTPEHCEVFRLAFIKKLARDPRLGLEQEYPLGDRPLVVDTGAKAERLAGWMKSEQRQLPAIVAIERSAEAAPPLPSLEELNKVLSATRPGIRPPLPPVASVRATPPLADMTVLARYRMGYAQYFIVRADKAEAFRKACWREAAPGDLILWDPLRFGGKRQSISARRQEQEPAAVADEAERYAREYCLGKSMDFGTALFLPEAKLTESEHALAESGSVTALLLAFEEKEQAYRETCSAELMAAAEKLAQAEQKIDRLKRSIEEQDAVAAEQAVAADRREAALRLALAEKEDEIAWLRSLSQRPKLPGEVSDWVAGRFDGRLIFHQRATELMEALRPGEVDMKLLCDALEYLATEYRDELLGRLTENECKARCGKKYGRPFEVVPCRSTSTEAYPSEYRIKYYPGYHGKPAESPLDLHLRVGRDSEKLLRIYFLYDKEKQLIVVGSLPKHLKTMSF